MYPTQILNPPNAEVITKSIKHALVGIDIEIQMAVRDLVFIWRDGGFARA